MFIAWVSSVNGTEIVLLWYSDLNIEEKVNLGTVKCASLVLFGVEKRQSFGYGKQDFGA
jgi:hypothetical protein